MRGGEWPQEVELAGTEFVFAAQKLVIDLFGSFFFLLGSDGRSWEEIVLEISCL